MKIELKTNIKELEKDIDNLPLYDIVEKSMNRIGVESQANVKEKINSFINEKGNKQGVDTGAFRDSVYLKMHANKFGFTIGDGVPYGIWHETGTKKHWVPFFDRSGRLTSLGQWAIRHFSQIGFQVKGKKGKVLKKPSRDQRFQVLKQKKGMRVSLSEMRPFEGALYQADRIAPRIFSKTFDEEMSNRG